MRTELVRTGAFMVSRNTFIDATEADGVMSDCTVRKCADIMAIFTRWNMELSMR